MKYKLLILLSALDLLGAAGCVLGAVLLFTKNPDNLVLPVILMIAAIVLFVLKMPIENMRLESREQSRYDEYGRLKTKKTYEKMSAKEQEEIDRINQLDMERILPSSVIRSMTHKGSDDPTGDMNRLIGMQGIKEKMEEMAASMEFDSQDGKQHAPSCQHMCFFGPPGTGKTTVARIMTGFLYKYGYIRENRIIETDGNFLADNKGVASDKVDMLIQRSFGGVLFIDEAYALLDNMSGREAISSIVKQMEDHKDKFVLIMAGYEPEMRALIHSNPGFTSRIKDYFFFESYSVDELGQMFVANAKKDGFTVSDEALIRFKRIMAKAIDGPDFGNARTVRNVFDRSRNKHSLNFKKGIVKTKYELQEEDIVYEVSPL